MVNINMEVETSGSKTGRRCNYWCIAGLLFLIGVVGLAVLLSLYLHTKFAVCSSCTGLQYGIIVDAGSSKSELSLFRWNGEKLKETGEVFQLIDCKTDKGIASYGDSGQPEEAGKSLTGCLNETVRIVPDDRRQITPIYLGATAGMRILQKAKPDEAKAVFDSVRKVFEAAKLKIPPNNVRIITEQEEGSYAWIAANFIQKTLGQAGGKVPTSGILDMGGASTQIAFETDERNPNASVQDYDELRLFGHDFTIFTHSYLCFGQDQIIKRAKAQVVLNSPRTTLYDHPCLHRDHQIDITVQDLFDQTCTVPPPENLGSLKKDSKILFRGTGKIAECNKLIDELLDPTNCKNKGYEYCFEHNFLPKREGKFIAMSSFFFAYSYLNKGNTAKSQEEYRTIVEGYCTQSWPDVKAKAEGEKIKQQDEHLSAYCFTGLFTHKLIGGIYGLSGDRWHDVTFTKKVNGVSVGWSLGLMTNATTMIPSEKIGKSPKVVVSEPITDIFYVLLAFFGVLILIVLIISYRAWARRSNTVSFRGDHDGNDLFSLCCPKS